MVKIRYRLMGRSGQRLFWIIAIDSRRQRDSGNYLEYLGFYNPYTKEAKLEKEKIKNWLNHGAQPTKSLQQLLKKHL